MSAVPLLVPDPLVLGVQVGIFLTSVYVVKSKILDPYLRLKDKRESLTGGSNDKSLEFIKKTEELSQKLEAEMKIVRLQSKQEAEALKLQANQKREELIKSAEQQADTIFERNSLQLNEGIRGFRADQTMLKNIASLLVSRVLKV